MLLLGLLVSVANAQQTAADFFNEGIAKSNAKYYPGALQAFAASIILNPENAASYYNRALTKSSLNDLLSANLDLDRTIDLNLPMLTRTYTGFKQDQTGRQARSHAGF